MGINGGCEIIGDMKRKHQMTSGEREEPSLNPFRLMVALSAIFFLCFLLYALLEPYLPADLTHENKPRVEIVPYATPTDAVAIEPIIPTEVPVVIPSDVPPLPTETPVPVLVMNGRMMITLETASYVAELADLRGISNEISSVTFSSDGTYLASGSRDGTVRLWDVASRTELQTFRSSGDWVESVAFSSSGFQLAAAGQDNIVRSWNLVTNQELPALQGPQGALRSISFNPRGTVLAAASDDGNVYLWDVQSGDQIASLRGHTGFVTSIAYSADGTLLASGGEDDTVRLWDPASYALLATLNGHSADVTSVAFSPDGTLLVSSDSSGVAIVWDVAARSQLSKLVGDSEQISDVAFGGLSRMVATSAKGITDNTVRLWNAETGELVRVIELDGPANSIAFNPDGTLLAIGGGSYLTLWSVSSQAPAAAAPESLGPENFPTAGPEVSDEVPQTADGQGGFDASSGFTGSVNQTCTLTSEYPDVNVRTGPGEDFDVARALELGDTVQANGWTLVTTGTWWRLTDGNWVWAGVVSETDGCNQMPAVEP